MYFIVFSSSSNFDFSPTLCSFSFWRGQRYQVQTNGRSRRGSLQPCDVMFGQERLLLLIICCRGSFSLWKYRKRRSFKSYQIVALTQQLSSQSGHVTRHRSCIGPSRRANLSAIVLARIFNRCRPFMFSQETSKKGSIWLHSSCSFQGTISSLAKPLGAQFFCSLTIRESSFSPI